MRTLRFVGRLAASSAALLAVVWLGRLAPVQTPETPVTERSATEMPATEMPATDSGSPRIETGRPTASEGNFSVDGEPREPGPISAFVFDGIPLASETRRTGPCDPDTWSPADEPAWGETSLLLGVERRAGEAVATWLELPPGVAGAAALASSVTRTDGARYHVARLTCRAANGGELVHAWTPRPLDPQNLARLGEPVTRRNGPVPLLDESVQLLAFRNLDWSLFLDEPADPARALEHLEAAMQMRGWARREIPDPLPDAPAPVIDLAAGLILEREGGGLCVLRTFRADSRDLLLTACRGLT